MGKAPKKGNSGEIKCHVRGQSSLSASIRMKRNFSEQHLRAAELFAHEARKIESEKREIEITEWFRHSGYVTAAVLSAVAYLEAWINELYQSAIDRESNILRTFDTNLFRLFGEVWEYLEKHPTLEKYQIALLLAGKEPFATGAQPYQDADDLIELRNCLVHYKSKWVEVGKPQHLEKRLRHKNFSLNPYIGTGGMWFPDRCLGAGCAEWSVNAARCFSDGFCDRLGI
jgi:hypothetical protein